MSIFTGKMSKKTKELYDFMWGSRDELADCIEPTSKRENGQTTYRFKTGLEDKCEQLRQQFDLNEAELQPKFRCVCDGDGNEAEKIMTLHSSSLCALLFFYNVSEENPIRLSVHGEDVVFDRVRFEFKNPVIRNASNMDVVLWSKDRKHVLFLESKFSEYYLGASKNSSPISDAYRKEGEYSEVLYRKAVMEKLGIAIADGDRTDSKFVIVSKNGEKVYLDGIKQMISHYVGIRKRLDGKVVPGEQKKPCATEIIEAVHGGAKVYLGEILFDFENTIGTDEGEKTEFRTVAEAYRNRYEELAKEMNACIKTAGLEGRFFVLEKNLGYSEMRLCHQVDSKVLEYYRM